MPRIDSLRNHVMAPIELLEITLADIETLHPLAYDRSHAHEQIRIRGGMPDSALDRYGDPVARKVYKELTNHIQRARNSIVTEAYAALSAIEETDRAVKRKKVLQPVFQLRNCSL